MPQVQSLPPALTGVKPNGSVSVTVIAALVTLEPSLLAVIVYVPVSPRTKFPVCVLLRLKSGASAPSVTLERSSPVPSFGLESGSGVSDFVTSVVFVIEPVANTFAVMLSVCVPVVTLESVQMPVEASYEPRLGLLETNCRPLGNGSLTSTFSASLGPALVRVIVKVTF
jgi:hypothetical protein